jgi:hypothetical protein
LGARNDRVLLGAELDVWNKAVAGATDRIASLLFVFYAYPKLTSRLFIKGGIGLSSFSESETALPASSGHGMAVLAGLGYDIPAWRGLFLTPVVNLAYGQVGDVNVGSLGYISGWRQVVVDLGLGITAHTPWP